MIYFFWSSTIHGVMHYIMHKNSHHSLNIFFFLFFLPIFIFYVEGRNNLYGEVFHPLSCMLSTLLFFTLVIYLIILGAHFKGRTFIFSLTMIMLMSSLVVFSQDNFFLFFLFFEMSVLPILLIIISSGKSSSRGEATAFLLLFTISTSLLFLFSLIFLLSLGDLSLGGGGENFYSSSNWFLQFCYSLFLTTTFFVKFPIFLFHIWLPKAHVEAPTLGSMILAAILLKLGGVGVFLFEKVFSTSLPFFEVISIFSVWGGIWAGMVCFKQDDSKILIAYSSINHMALVIFGLLVGTSISVGGATYVMVGHGFISSLIFFLNGSMYMNISSRGGGEMKYPSSWLFFIWLFACFVNAGFPPFINFLGELMVLSNILMFPSLTLPLLIHFIIGIIYSITLGSFFLKKKYSFLQKFSNSGLFFQIFISILHIIPLFIFFNLEIMF